MLLHSNVFILLRRHIDAVTLLNCMLLLYILLCCYVPVYLFCYVTKFMLLYHVQFYIVLFYYMLRYVDTLLCSKVFVLLCCHNLYQCNKLHVVLCYFVVLLLSLCYIILHCILCFTMCMQCSVMLHCICCIVALCCFLTFVFTLLYERGVIRIILNVHFI